MTHLISGQHSGGQSGVWYLTQNGLLKPEVLGTSLKSPDSRGDERRFGVRDGRRTALAGARIVTVFLRDSRRCHAHFWIAASVGLSPLW